MHPALVPVDPKSALEPPEVMVVDSHRVWCDGGGALGHPRIYLEMGGRDYVECPYCDRRFVMGRDHGEDERLDPAANEGANASRA